MQYIGTYTKPADIATKQNVEEAVNTRQNKIDTVGILRGIGDGVVESADAVQSEFATTETWSFTLEDGTVVTKQIPVLGG